MELRANAAKVVDLATTLDSVPEHTVLGPILSASIRIEYTLAGLAPTVDIRVPVPFEPSETEAEHHAHALRRARLLIDHACRAAGIVPDEPAPPFVANMIEGIIPQAMQGVIQELGIPQPTTQLKCKRP